MKNTIILIMFLPLVLFAQVEQDNTKIQPQLGLEAGFALGDLYNFGYDITLNYYPFSNSWLRLGPSFTFANTYTPYKDWIPNGNDATNLDTDILALLGANFEFLPFKKSSFFVGITPYVGYHAKINKGTTKNEVVNLDIDHDYRLNKFDWGLQFKLGGYFGKQERFGAAGKLVFSSGGIADDNPTTKFYNFDKNEYKSYVGFMFLYRIK